MRGNSLRPVLLAAALLSIDGALCAGRADDVKTTRGGRQSAAARGRDRAEEKSERRSANAQAAADAEPMAVTPSREAAAVAFAREHHPELGSLLVQLKKSNRSEYDKAVRELFRTSERLARIRERTPERHELALQAWKVESRIRLLTARMMMKEDAPLEAELRAALDERIELRLRQLEAEQERLGTRLEDVTATLEETRTRRAEIVERDFARLSKNFRGARPGSGGAGRQRPPLEPTSTSDKLQ